jgi:hypothetical protein
MPTLRLVLLLVAVLPAALAADDEASNVPVIAVDQWGRCYAKSVPSESYGSAGSTRVYAVTARADVLLDSYSWYANQIRLACNVSAPGEQSGTSIVQFGPWARGQKASEQALALAFHFRGRLLRRYSTLDIAGSPDGVSASVSHYTVIRQVDGYKTNASNRLVFEVVTVDGRRLTFEPTTGELVASVRETSSPR